jgi:hypothetical protein
LGYEEIKMNEPSDEDDREGWLKTLISAVIQGLIRAGFDFLEGRGGR